MKRMIIAAMAACMAVLTACGASAGGTAASGDVTTAVTTAADTASETTAEETTTAATEAETTAEETTTAEEKEIGMEQYQDMIVKLPPEGYDETREGVTYPQFQTTYYYSNTAERDTLVNVLLPTDYSEDKEYPVLYILHGFWDTQDWMARDVVALPQILTNLQLDGEAEEMIVVLPYIFCSKEMEYCTGMDDKNCLAYDNFINDLQTDLMPFIEKNYSVAKGRDNTAITGFSMGGREALFIGLQMQDVFGYVGAVCPAPGLVNIPGSPMHSGQIEPSDMVFEQKPNILFITSSKADNVVWDSPDSYRRIFDENGEPYLTQVIDDTYHDHTSVKPHLYNYFRLLFK
ncbi:MAG: hypothetical protein IKR73_01590 [Oscillospiraceae bacterium]|nr:hypothetical protein [Oscillospiraceae bacterium]